MYKGKTFCVFALFEQMIFINPVEDKQRYSETFSKVIQIYYFLHLEAKKEIYVVITF